MSKLPISVTSWYLLLAQLFIKISYVVDWYWYNEVGYFSKRQSKITIYKSKLSSFVTSWSHKEVDSSYLVCRGTQVMVF